METQRLQEMMEDPVYKVSEGILSVTENLVDSTDKGIQKTKEVVNQA